MVFSGMELRRNARRVVKGRIRIEALGGPLQALSIGGFGGIVDGAPAVGREFAVQLFIDDNGTSREMRAQAVIRHCSLPDAHGHCRIGAEFSGLGDASQFVLMNYLIDRGG